MFSKKFKDRADFMKNWAENQRLNDQVLLFLVDLLDSKQVLWLLRTM